MALEVERLAVSSEFARSQLTKCGWEDGKGLGRDEQGIKNPIKVSGKNDKQGLGVDQSEQFVFHWWDHVFNKVASSIKVEDEDGEVKLSKEEDSEKVGKISNKRPTNAAKGKELLYGRFVRSGTYNDKDANVDIKSAESSEDESKLDFSKNDTLEKVFKLSGGRTAHKAARHGHRLNGKLKRLEEQEKNSPAATPQLSPKHSSEGSVDHDDGYLRGVEKKNKKRKCGENFLPESKGFTGDALESKKRKKNKKKDKKMDDINAVSKCKSVNGIEDTEDKCNKNPDSSESTKKKKKRKVTDFEDGDQQTGVENKNEKNNGDLKSKRIKKKKKVTCENSDEITQIYSNESEDKQSSLGKKSKKSKKKKQNR